VLAAQWGLLPPIGVAPARPGRPRRARLPSSVRPVPRLIRVGGAVRVGGAGGAGAAGAAGHAGGRRVAVLTAVSARGFDPLDADDPFDENSDLAGFAIDKNLQTAWQEPVLLGNPVFGGLKAGSGLIVDMGSRVRLSSVEVTFGAAPGADVAIEVGNHDTLAAATLATFRTVASADGIGGIHTSGPRDQGRPVTCSSGSPSCRRRPRRFQAQISTSPSAARPVKLPTPMRIATLTFYAPFEERFSPTLNGRVRPIAAMPVNLLLSCS